MRWGGGRRHSRGAVGAELPGCIRAKADPMDVDRAGLHEEVEEELSF